jgi:hypothetical protein
MRLGMGSPSPWLLGTVVVSGIVIVAVVTTNVILRSQTTPQNAITDYADGDLALRYPSSWRTYDFGVRSTRGAVLLVLASIPLREPCVTRIDVTECDTGNYLLPPNSVVLEISSTSSMLGETLGEFATGQPVVVGRRAAFLTVLGDERRTGADKTLIWTIEREVAHNFFQVRAEIRGPSLATLESEVRAVVESLEFRD